MQITLDFQQSSTMPNIPSEDCFQQWVEMALEGKYTDAELCIRIIDDEEMAELNATYRNKQGPTNVLSFPAQMVPGLPLNILGDILIAAPTVLKEAREQNKKEIHHWAHLTIHGVLHLIGYDHMTAEEAEVMEQLERHIMAKLAFPNPYLIEMEEK